MILLKACFACGGDLERTSARVARNAEGAPQVFREEFACINCARDYIRELAPLVLASPPLSRGRHLGSRNKGADDG